VLEPHNRHWLFALETAASLPERARMSFDGQVIATSLVRSRLRYELASVIAPEPVAREDLGTLRRALRLPPGYNPRTLELAAQWRAASRSDDELLGRERTAEIYREMAAAVSVPVNADGERGFGGPEAMAESLRRFLVGSARDAGAARCFREACRRHALAHYTWDRSLDGLETLLWDLASSGAPGATAT